MTGKGVVDDNAQVTVEKDLDGLNQWQRQAFDFFTKRVVAGKPNILLITGGRGTGKTHFCVQSK